MVRADFLLFPQTFISRVHYTNATRFEFLTTGSSARTVYCAAYNGQNCLRDSHYSSTDAQDLETKHGGDLQSRDIKLAMKVATKPNLLLIVVAVAVMIEHAIASIARLLLQSAR